MTQIDWSKAPEGTTHRDIKYGLNGFWYKLDFKNDTAAYCPPGENGWIRSGKASEYNDGSLDHMVARPANAPSGQLTEDEREERLIAMSHAYQDATGRSPNAYIKEAFIALDAEGYRKVEVKP